MLLPYNDVSLCKQNVHSIDIYVSMGDNFCDCMSSQSLPLTSVHHDRQISVKSIKLKDEEGKTIICSSAKAKADSLSNFFSTVFVMKETGNLSHFMIEYVLKNSTQ